MFKYLAVLFLMSFSAGNVNCQTNKDTIIVNDRMYILQGKTLRPWELVYLMNTDNRARGMMRTAKTNYDFSVILKVLGGAAMIYSFKPLLKHEKPDWYFTAGGCAVLYLSIPLNYAYHKRAKKAIELYNQRLKLKY